MTRRADIDAAKGLAILLVVFGHVVARETPPGGEWYSVAKGLVYTFHMPLFIFLNGFVFALSWEPRSQFGEQLSLGWKRASRLFPPFLVMGLIVFAGKLFASHYVPVDNPVNGLASLVDLLLRPTASFSSFLWYLYALGIIFLTFPFLYRLCGRQLFVLLIIAALFYLLPASEYFAWGWIRQLFFFFVLGIVAAKNIGGFDRLIKSTWYLWGVLLCGIWIVWGGEATKLVCGALAIPFAMGLVRLNGSQGSKFLEWVGRYTLSIYLFNTIFIGISKALVSRFATWNEHTFFLFFFVLFVSGVFAPILFKRNVLKKVRLLDKYT